MKLHENGNPRKGLLRSIFVVRQETFMLHNKQETFLSFFPFFWGHLIANKQTGQI